MRKREQGITFDILLVDHRCTRCLHGVLGRKSKDDLRKNAFIIILHKDGMSALGRLYWLT